MKDNENRLIHLSQLKVAPLPKFAVGASYVAYRDYDW